MESLQKFEELVHRVSATYAVDEVHEDQFIINSQKDSEIHCTFVALTHGNEPGGLFAFNAFLEDLIAEEINLEVPIALVVAHRKAALQNKRFIERDLNRCFGHTKKDTMECFVAKDIEPILLRSKFVLDIHQTKEPSQSDFFIFPMTASNVHWAQTIGANVPIVVHGKDFSKDGMTLDTFTTLHGITSLTYEMGEIKYCEKQITKTKEMMVNALSSEIPESFNDSIIELDGLLSWSQVFYNEPGSELVNGYKNFSPVKKGEELGISQGKPIFAELDGFVLFPKYGDMANKSTELCRVISNASTTGVS